MKTKQRSAEQAESYIVLTFKVHKEEDQYVSECVELGVGSQGDTLDDAFTAIEEATVLYLSTLEDLHERERVFSERGIKLIQGEPKNFEGVSLTAQLREYISPKAVRIPAIRLVHEGKARSRNDLLVSALRNELAAQERAATDQAFAEMAGDAEAQSEALSLAREFAQADTETLTVGKANE